MLYKNILDYLQKNKQDALTFDSTPTANSANPVTSGGVKAALDEKEDSLTFDSTPTANSTNPVTSGGVKSALDTRDTTIADNRPLPITISSVAALPRTISSAKIKSNHVVEGNDLVLSNPSAQLSDWNVDTYDGSLTISGTISGTTDISFHLVPAQDALSF